jgi:hypothetical protein
MIPKGTYLHIQGAGCLGTKGAVIKTNNDCIMDTMRAIGQNWKQSSSIVELDEEADRSIGTLWGLDSLRQVCSANKLWDEAKLFEMERWTRDGAQDSQEWNEDRMRTSFLNRRPNMIAVDANRNPKP